MAGGITSLVVEEKAGVCWKPAISRERAQAITGLLEDNVFILKSLPHAGPFHLKMELVETRLYFMVESLDGRLMEEVSLSLSPLHPFIKDYFAIFEAYTNAQREQHVVKLEAIDLGRKGLHDEAARLLSERLSEVVEIDHNTARHLFSLICVLHMREMVWL